MHRCFIDSGNWNDREMVLSEGERHHLLRVLRAKSGDKVTVFDGGGREADAVLLDSSDAKLAVKSSDFHPRPSPELILFQAVPKGKRMDFVIEKSTELGVRSIVPMSTERGVVRLSSGQKESHLERWKRIAVSSAKQCGTRWVPDIQQVLDFSSAMTLAGRYDLLFIGSLEKGADLFARALEKSDFSKAKSIGLIIGPEGDFTREEIRSTVSAGAVPVSFGDLVLRVETAALYGLSVLSYELTRV